MTINKQIDGNKMKTLSPHAHAAKLIKQDLKKAFPDIKFRVVSKAYSMGNAVSAYWIDGPESKEVRLIIDKYQYGYFNGMEDIYENTNSRDDIPQVKYVTVTRERSECVFNIED